jgi:hypothetical protein
MSKKKEIALHIYLKKLSSAQKKEVAKLLKKETGINYIYQTIAGTNMPAAGLTMDIFINYSKKHHVDGCYLTQESILAGYQEMKEKKSN